MKYRLKIVVMLFAAALLATTAFAGEGRPGAGGAGAGGGRQWDRALERMRDAAPPEIQLLIDKQLAGDKLAPAEMQRLRDYAATRVRDRVQPPEPPPEIKPLLDKRQKGEQLTQEEQDRLDKFMRDQQNARGMMMRGAGARFGAAQPEFFARVDTNPRDAAIIRMAEILHKQGKNKEAIDTLAAVIKDSPEAQAVAAAHLDSARIYRKNLLLPDKAAEEFLAVRGPLSKIAIRELAEMYEESGEPEQAVALLKAARQKAASKLEELEIMTSIADIYERAGQSDNAIATLKEIVNDVTYDEAMKLHAPPQAPPVLQAPPAPPKPQPQP